MGTTIIDSAKATGVEYQLVRVEMGRYDSYIIREPNRVNDLLIAPEPESDEEAKTVFAHFIKEARRHARIVASQ